MKRRQFLQWTGGWLLGGLGGVRAVARSAERIVIVGGGIVGASIAYHLARRGAAVTLLEKTQPAAGASGKSFAWINANFSKQPRDYHWLNRLGVQAWHQLHQQLGDELPVRWGGTLEWYAKPGRAEELDRLARQQQAWGYPIRSIDAAELARIEPRLVPGKVLAAAFTALEGATDSGQATRVLLRHAERAGARILHPCEVQGIESRGAGVVLRTTQGEVDADKVVLASGVETESLAALLGVKVPLEPAPGIVVRSTPQPQVLRSVFNTEDSHVHQQADGRFVMGDDYDPPQTKPHHALDAYPADFPRASLSAKHGERIRSQAAQYVPALADAPIESVALCWRPMPRDGYPILGYAPSLPQVYVTVTHSGVTLAPLIGELAALELLDGAQVDLLAPYRPARFVS